LVISGRHAFAIRCRPGFLDNSQEQPQTARSLLFPEAHAVRKPRKPAAENDACLMISVQITAKTASARFSAGGGSRSFTSLWCELALGTSPPAVMPAKAGTQGLPLA
jgi:hypothetical protein